MLSNVTMKRLGQTRALLMVIVRLHFITILKLCMPVCIHRCILLKINRDLMLCPLWLHTKDLLCAWVISEANLPLFTVWSLSVQWTASLFSTIVPHSLKHLSLKCLQRQINCHQEFKPGNWEWKGIRTYWIILHEMMQSSFSPWKR